MATDIVNTPSITSTPISTATTEPRDLEAGIRRSNAPRGHLDENDEKSILNEVDEAEEQDDDIDKVIAAVAHPRRVPSGETHARSSRPIAHALAGNGSELAILGFTNRGDYWEHAAFGRSRITAIVIASVAICCLMYCLTASTWVYSGIRKST